MFRMFEFSCQNETRWFWMIKKGQSNPCPRRGPVNARDGFGWGRWLHGRFARDNTIAHCSISSIESIIGGHLPSITNRRGGNLEPTEIPSSILCEGWKNCVKQVSLQGVLQVFRTLGCYFQSALYLRCVQWSCRWVCTASRTMCRLSAMWGAASGVCHGHSQPRTFRVGGFLSHK